MGKQNDAWILGRYGCCFFCLLHIAEEVMGKRLEAIYAYEDGVDSGCIGQECYVQHPQGLMERWTGLLFGYEHCQELPQPKPKQWVLARLVWQDKGKMHEHFVIQNAEGKTVYDPYEGWEHGQAIRVESYRRVWLYDDKYQKGAN